MSDAALCLVRSIHRIYGVVTSALKLGQRFAEVDRRLGLHPFITGDDFTVADGYLFTVSNWAAYVNLDLSPWSNLLAFRARVGERPAVLAALEAEGLRKPAR